MSKEDSFEEEFPSLKGKEKLMADKVDELPNPTKDNPFPHVPNKKGFEKETIVKCCVDKERLQDVIEKAKNTVRDSDSFDTGWKGALNMIEVELGL